MNEELVERIIKGFENSLDRLEQGNKDIYSKIGTVMDKLSGHDGSIRVLEQKSIEYEKNITKLFGLQEDAITSQSNLIKEMGSGNKQNFIIAIMVVTLVISLIGFFSKFLVA